ncbi:hypothetical protein AX15_000240 [Amanita polypyramis BW_CC]|nr:hypothetical protein AX15_000240 [Amanita polypyramis BW_CC]
MKDVLLVGFGAIGAICSLTLKTSGRVRLTVVARSNYEAVKGQGMTYHSYKYGELHGWRPDRLCKSVEEAADREYSHVFVATKAVPEIVKTPDILSPLLREPYADKYRQPAYIVMQNGLGVERDLYKAIEKLGKGKPKVIGSAVRIAANLTAPNAVLHTAFNAVILGMYKLDDMATSTNTAEEIATLEEVKEILSAGGSDVEIVSQIQWAKFAKNIWNIIFSSITALSGHSLTAFYRPPPTKETGLYEPYVFPVTAHKIETFTLPNVRAALLETLALARALGIPDSEEGIPSTYVDTMLNSVINAYVAANSVHKPSMMVDMEKGSPMEVEAILGEVVSLAKKYGIDIPRIEMLYGLLLVKQNQILRKRCVA